MSGGASAQTMYDHVYEMIKNKSYPTIDWKFLDKFLKLFPIPPTAMVVQGEQTAFKMADGIAERQQLENEKLKVEIENEKAKGASAPPSKDESHSEQSKSVPSEHSDKDYKSSTLSPSDKTSKKSRKVKKAKGSTVGGDDVETDVQTGGILFTNEECSFF